MTYNYTFSNDESWREDFREAYSLVAKSRNQFLQENDCIKNSYNEAIKEHDYISIAHKKTFKTGTTAKLACSFEKYGAPLITLANSIELGDDGYLIYGDHYEIIVWECGCNVYFVGKAPEHSPKPFIAQNCLRVYFSNEADSVIELEVATGKRQGFVSVEVCGHSFELPVPNLNDEFIIGFTACEGINRLYSAVIDTP